MKRALPLVALSVAVLAAHVVLSHYPRTLYLFAHLALVTVLYVGFRWNELTGIVFGLLIGLGVATLDGAPIALDLMVFPLAGWAAGLWPKHFDISPLPLQALLATLIVLCAAVLRPLLISGFSGDWPEVGLARFAAPIAAALLYSAPLYLWLDRLIRPPRRLSLGPLSSPRRDEDADATAEKP